MGRLPLGIEASDIVEFLKAMLVYASGEHNVPDYLSGHFAYQAFQLLYNANGKDCPLLSKMATEIYLSNPTLANKVIFDISKMIKNRG
jgi:hypothetical protein